MNLMSQGSTSTTPHSGTPEQTAAAASSRKESGMFQTLRKATLAVALFATLTAGSMPATPDAIAACPARQQPCTLPHVIDARVQSAGGIGGNTRTNQYYVDGASVRFESFKGKPARSVPSQVTVQVQYLINGKSAKSYTLTLKAGQTQQLPRLDLPASFRPTSECAPGNDVVTVVVDPNNKLKETNEKNNTGRAFGIIC